MASGRMLRTQISLSIQVNDLSIKSALLFTWIIPHVDDYGRLHADPRRIKASVVPMRDDINIDDVKCSLIELHEKKLIKMYTIEDETYLEIPKFEKHQDGLHRRSASKIPAPEGSNDSSLSEKDIEDYVINLMEESLIEVSSSKIVSYERQMRIQNSYVDIFCTLSDDRKVIFKIKRQRITDAAINQVINYGNLIGGNPLLVLIGCGISANIDTKNCPVILANFEENFTIKNINFDEKTGLLIHVNSCYLTLNDTSKRHLPLNASRARVELNRTELNRTEQKSFMSGCASHKPDASVLSQKNSKLKKQAIEVLDFLNERLAKKFRHVDANLDLIIARLKSGVTIQQCKFVIVQQWREWDKDEKMSKYLRPSTLFNKTKFEQYLGELIQVPEES